jgi:hypothetical protein
VIFLGVALAIIQQVTGINTVIYYAPTIFREAGFHSDASALVATAGVGVVNMLMTVVAIPPLDRLGRRPLLLAEPGRYGFVARCACSRIRYWRSVAFHKARQARCVELNNLDRGPL